MSILCKDEEEFKSTCDRFVSEGWVLRADDDIEIGQACILAKMIKEDGSMLLKLITWRPWGRILGSHMEEMSSLVNVRGWISFMTPPGAWTLDVNNMKISVASYRRAEMGVTECLRFPAEFIKDDEVSKALSKLKSTLVPFQVPSKK